MNIWSKHWMACFLFFQPVFSLIWWYSMSQSQSQDGNMEKPRLEFYSQTVSLEKVREVVEPTRLVVDLRAAQTTACTPGHPISWAGHLRQPMQMKLSQIPTGESILKPPHRKPTFLFSHAFPPHPHAPFPTHCKVIFGSMLLTLLKPPEVASSLAVARMKGDETQMETQ